MFYCFLRYNSLRFNLFPMFLKKLFGLFCFGVLFVMGGCSFFGGAGGVVVDVNGDSIEGALVVVDGEMSSTDKDGEFDVGDGEVVVSAEGYVSFRGVVGDDGRIVLDANPYRSVLGYLYDENGPLEDAFVICLDPNSFEPAGVFKVSNGYAYFPGILESETVFLGISDGYDIGFVILKIDGEDDNFVLEMQESSLGLVSDGAFFETAFADTWEGYMTEYPIANAYFNYVHTGDGTLLNHYMKRHSVAKAYADHFGEAYTGHLIEEKSELSAILALLNPVDIPNIDVDINIDLGGEDPTGSMRLRHKEVDNRFLQKIDVSGDDKDGFSGFAKGMRSLDLDMDEPLWGDFDKDLGAFDLGEIDIGDTNMIVLSIDVDSDTGEIKRKIYVARSKDIVDSVLDGDLKGGGELDLFFQGSDGGGLVAIPIERGLADESSNNDEGTSNYLIGVPPEGPTEPPLDPDYVVYLACMHAVNQKHADVYFGCLAEYGEPGEDDQALADEIGKCLNSDAGYKADSEACE